MYVHVPWVCYSYSCVICSLPVCVELGARVFLCESCTVCASEQSHMYMIYGIHGVWMPIYMYLEFTVHVC